MAGPIEDKYFNWLCAKVLEPQLRVYVDLLKIMHGTEFVWRIPGDRNRADDGMELRREFMYETHTGPDPTWEATGCSVLEMLFAFSRRAEFQTSMPAQEWFWKMIENLRLDDFRHISPGEDIIVREAMHALVWRTYDSSGLGGLFPMRWPRRDQREAEIWYQFCEYVEEQRLT